MSQQEGTGLTKPHTINSLAHSSIGTLSPGLLQAPTACKYTVSGTISPPSPGCFSPFPHGTIHYRSRKVFSLGS